MKQVKFTLDNLVYNLVINSNEPIQFVLPLKVPNPVFDVKKNENGLFAAIEQSIKCYITTKEYKPEVTVVSEYKDAKLVYSGSLELVQNSITEIEFSTFDGGKSWLVNSCLQNATSAEHAVEIASGASETATKATEVSNQALTQSGTAIETSNQALEQSGTAIETSNAAAAAAKASVQACEDFSIAVGNVQTVLKDTNDKLDDQRVATEQQFDAVNHSLTSVFADVESQSENLEQLNETTTQHTEAITAVTASAEESAKKTKSFSVNVNNDVILQNGKKFLLQRHSGDTPVGMFMGYYPELRDKATNDGLEQVEVGTPKAILCLNHCGATFIDATGVETTVDGHIRVDWKENLSSKTNQDQLAYMSDLKAINDKLTDLTTKYETIIEQLKNIVEKQNETIQSLQDVTKKQTTMDETLQNITQKQTEIINSHNIAVKHIINTENSVFWISDTTLKPTRETVDPDTLDAMTEVQ